MSDVQIVKWNETPNGKVAFCGYKNTKSESFITKKEWTQNEEEKHALQHKVLYSEKDGIFGGIEYLPGEYAWRPVTASGFMFINCIYIIKKNCKGHGFGKMMLKECEKDAAESGMKGVAAVTRKGSWMAGSGLFSTAGYERIDTAPPDFELMVKTYNNSAAAAFIKDLPDPKKKYAEGVYILFSNQCPYLAKSVPEMLKAAEEQFGITPNYIRIDDPKKAMQNPSYYGTFTVIVNGKICEDRPISKTRFINILKKEMP